MRAGASSDVALFEVGQIFLGPGENDQRIAAAAVRRGRAKADAEGRQLERRRARRRLRRQARRDDASLGARREPERGPGRPRRPVVPASRPRGDAQVRAEDGRRLVRSIAPKRLRGARRRRADRRASRSCSTPFPAPKAKPTKTKPKLDRSDFMPVERDLAFVVGESGRRRRHREGGARAPTARSSPRSACSTSIAGKGLPEGAKSIAIHVTLQPRERTLTDAEIDAAMSRIVAEVSRKTGATLRS